MISGPRQLGWFGDQHGRTAMQDGGSPAGGRSARAGTAPVVDLVWLAATAAEAAADAAAPVDLLGRYLSVLADAALNGSRPDRDDLLPVAASGRRAAREGVAPGQAVDLYLS